jgi:hypothetical protein
MSTLDISSLTILHLRGKATFDVPQRAKLSDKQEDHIRAVSKVSVFEGLFA